MQKVFGSYKDILMLITAHEEEVFKFYLIFKRLHVPPFPNSAAAKFADLLGSVRRGSGPITDGEGRSSTPPPAVLSAPSLPHTPVVPMQSKWAGAKTDSTANDL
ncbi:hypothetical protein ATANTOWER_029173 [Ataeniobius toweri]|uniref:Uncharacterized protein n=1 Tax=Ataeniobius toweri TaxID=208326 RepID=A0ABU7B382_9TELE|nr:hypothetical protein [Ataeniobius toweri]